MIITKVKAVLETMSKEEIKAAIEKILEADSLAEVKAILEEIKIEVTEEQCAKIVDALKAKAEVFNGDLELVAGGAEILSECEPTPIC